MRKPAAMAIGSGGSRGMTTAHAPRTLPARHGRAQGRACRAGPIDAGPRQSYGDKEHLHASASIYPGMRHLFGHAPWTPADVTLPPGVTLAVPDVDQIPELADLASKA